MSSMHTGTASLLALAALLVLPHAGAQTFSYDGNRWYEIEVSIFTNQTMDAANQELFLPANIELGYPQPIRELIPLQRFFSVDFDQDNAVMPPPQTGPAQPAASGGATDQEIMGPLYREPNQDFRLVDKDRTAFIALPVQEHEFIRFNQNIEGSPQHRMLYHAVWRQPVLNKVQSTAIFIRGGDGFGVHSELEGSLIISYNINRVDVDANLWRNSFNISSEQDWNVPEPPFLPENPENLFGLLIDQVYPLRETRQMISNQLHYLDHPAIGILIEVRPYELPPLVDFSLD